MSRASGRQQWPRQQLQQFVAAVTVADRTHAVDMTRLLRFQGACAAVLHALTHHSHNRKRRGVYAGAPAN